MFLAVRTPKIELVSRLLKTASLLFEAAESINAFAQKGQENAVDALIRRLTSGLRMSCLRVGAVQGGLLLARPGASKAPPAKFVRSTLLCARGGGGGVGQQKAKGSGSLLQS